MKRNTVLFLINMDSKTEEKEALYWLKRICLAVEQIQSNQETIIENQIEHKRELMATLSSLESKGSSITSSSSITNHINTVPVEQLSDPNSEEWQKQLNIRKHAFYHHIRSAGISAIYDNILKQTDPVIPLKFREKPIPGQSENHTKRQKKLEIAKVKTEIERLDEQTEKQLHIMDEAETQIKTLINRHESPEVRQNLIQNWLSDIKKEEDLSNSIWEKKKTFFQNENNPDKTKSNTHISNGPRNTNKKPNTYGNTHKNTHYEKRNIPRPSYAHPENEPTFQSLGNAISHLNAAVQGILQPNNKPDSRGNFFGNRNWRKTLK